MEVLKDFTGQSVQVTLEMARGFELHVPAGQGMQPTPVELRKLPAPHGDCVVVAVGVHVRELVPVEVTVGVPVTVLVSEEVPVPVAVSVEVTVTDGEKLGVAV